MLIGTAMTLTCFVLLLASHWNMTLLACFVTLYPAHVMLYPVLYIHVYTIYIATGSVFFVFLSLSGEEKGREGEDGCDPWEH